MNEYQALVQARKSCRICCNTHPGKIQNGGDFPFDPPVVSYWSQWLGHQKPKILIVGQDFADVGYFQRNQGCDDHDNRTNDQLRKLLGVAGLQVAPPPSRDSDAPVYLTNSILCLKTGQMASPVSSSWVRTCADQHLAPLLAHLVPPIVVGMGSHGWRAVRQVLKLEAAPSTLKDAAGRSWKVAGGMDVFAVGHCSGLGLVNRRWETQIEDWRRIGERLILTRLSVDP